MNIKSAKFVISFTLCFILFLTYLYPVRALQETVELESIVLMPIKSLFRATKSSYVITDKEIDFLPVHSPGEILKYIQGVDIKQRGVYGVQADVNIRGGSFEQTLILLDGVRMNDPHTGHHNMDLPITLEDIDRIEVIRGGSSSIYGANAFSGVINIITKCPESKKLIAEETLGEYSFSKQLLTLSYPMGKFSNSLSFERRESSSYKPETEFNIRTFYLNSLFKYDKGVLRCSLGYTDKNFGADSFYSDLYPREEEHTNTRFFNLNAQINYPELLIIPLVYYRRHWDKYILDRSRPSWYINYHTSYSYGGGLKLNFNLPFADFLIGTEIGEEKITSTQLGNYSRDKGAVFLEFNSDIKNKLMINLGLRETHYENLGWETSENVNIAYVITPVVKFRGSISKSFRIPSFTELYYDSPANKGDSNLNPEKNWTYELGMDFRYNQLIGGGITVFKRKADNLIDWVKGTTSDPWEAKNIDKMDTYGIEIESRFTPETLKGFNITELSLGYTYMDSNKDIGGLLSKYALNYLEHQFSSGIKFKFPKNCNLNTSLIYKQRVNQRHYFMLDAKLSKNNELRNLNIEYFINATNILNTSYSEVSGVSMPGRWVETGIRVEF